MNDWNPMIEQPRLDCVRIDGVELRQGDRVMLHPLGRAGHPGPGARWKDGDDRSDRAGF